MKKWQAKGGTTSDIRLLPIEAKDEDSAREKAREHFGNDDFDLEPVEDE